MKDNENYVTKTTTEYELKTANMLKTVTTPLIMNRSDEGTIIVTVNGITTAVTLEEWRNKLKNLGFEIYG